MSHPPSDPKITRNPKDILTEDDMLYIKHWVKEHFVPNSIVDSFWHPCVKKEWKHQQEKFELVEKMKRLDRESKNM